MGNIMFRQMYFDNDKDLQQLVNLQNEVYKVRGIRFNKEEFILWYVDNPAGKVISFNAFDGDKMIAHQCFVPCSMKVGDRVVKSIRSMNVVTLPEYRGRGLFSKMTNMAIDFAIEQGFELAYAITNANSYPMFMKYAGFTFVTRLEVKIGYGSNIYPDGERLYSNYWTSELLEWRLKYHKYYMKDGCVYSRYRPFVNTFMARLPENLAKDIQIERRSSPLGIYLYVGWGAKIKSPYFNVPKFVKHSPFNFIYRDLTNGTLPPITKENLFYQLLDYDVA